MLHTLISALQQTLIFLPLAFGVYLSYSILNLTDLTVEGSFVLGAAIFARLVTSGHSQTFSVIAALLGGFLIGAAVCLMQRLAKIDSLIAGILAVFMLYSVNFAIMGRPNIGLLSNHIALNYLQVFHPNGLWAFLIIFSLLIAIAIVIFLRSKYGLLLRACGFNPALLKRLGKKPALYLGLGLAASNCFSALCGIMTAQINGYADIHMGLGMALTAIGAVVIGTKLVQSLFMKQDKFSASIGLFSCLIGTYIYFLILNGFLAFGINPIYLKLALGLILVVFLSTAYYSGGKNNNHEFAAPFN